MVIHRHSVHSVAVTCVVDGVEIFVGIFVGIFAALSLVCWSDVCSSCDGGAVNGGAAVYKAAATTATTATTAATAARTAAAGVSLTSMKKV